jgi:hypothetical protein
MRFDDMQAVARGGPGMYGFPRCNAGIGQNECLVGVPQEKQPDADRDVT